MDSKKEIRGRIETMNEDLTDIVLPVELSKRVRSIFDSPTDPVTLEDLMAGWLSCGRPTCPKDLVLPDPTRHRVKTLDHERFVWCALDAMILAIVERKRLELQTSDPETGHMIEMSIDPVQPPICRNADQDPVLAFGFASGGFVDLKRSCCPYLNLFESLCSYDRWTKSRREAVTMPLTIEQAWCLALRWASAMAPASSVATPSIPRNRDCRNV